LSELSSMVELKARIYNVHGIEKCALKAKEDQ